MRIIFGFIFVILIFTGVNISAAQNVESVRISSPENLSRCEFSAEIAKTEKQIETGLMNRPNLPQDAAMYFDLAIIPKENPIAFWMKNTLIELDILFIDADGTVFDIKHNAQPNDTSLIWPMRRPSAALEINGGKAEKCGIKIGDILYK